ncbi:Prefoldin [Corchorus olitorius]|uniref:Prefoldin n=1 Tax=Corchorus olitorius TaxID=93759 RepID=A0A1R3GB29_9ROSI|nr:Prefoldin [Corchorus olitorius]
MEDIKKDALLGELRKENLRKSLEQVKAQASSVLLFTLEWNELQKHFDLVQSQIEKRIEAAESKEKQRETLERVLAEKQDEIRLKENELSSLNSKIDMELELKSTHSQLDSMRQVLNEYSSQYTIKKEDLDNVTKLIERYTSDLNSKKEELGCVQKLLTESGEKLKERETKLVKLEEEIEKSSKEIGLNSEKVQLLQLLVEECEKKLESEKKELGLVTARIDECLKNIHLKNDELQQLQRSIDEKSREFEMIELDIEFKESLMNELDEPLLLKEKELECLRNSIKECSDQLDLKQKELARSQELMEENCKQLHENENILNSMKSLIRDYNEEIEAKEKKHNALDTSLRDHTAKLLSKERELELLKEKIASRSAELSLRDIEFNSLQKLIKGSKKQVESTKKELGSLEAKVRAYSYDVELKEQELNNLQMCIEECRQELHFKEKKFSSVQVSIEGCSKQLKTGEEELTSIKHSIMECTKELDSKQKQLEAMQKSQKQLSDELESKEKQLGLMEKACNERQLEADVKEKGLDLKQKQLEAIQKSQKQLSDELESKEKQLGLMEKACNERQLEADAKEKGLDSLKRSLEERSEKLEAEKRQFEARVKELQLEADVKAKSLDSRERSIEERSAKLEAEKSQFEARVKEFETRMSSGNPGSSFSHVPEITNTGTVNLNMPRQIKTERPEHFTISNADESSPGALPADATRDGTSLQGIPIEHLDEAGLRKNEVLDTLRISPDPAKFVLDLMLETFSQQQRKGGTGFEEGVLNTYVVVLEQLMQVPRLIQPNVNADAMKLATEWKAKMELNAENSVEVLCFLLFVAAFGLVSSFDRDQIFKLLGFASQFQQARKVCQRLGLTDKIPDFISNLTKRKQYIEAVRFVCAFGIKDQKFAPEKLLNDFWTDRIRVEHDSCEIGNNLPEVQKVIDGQIAALKIVKQCIMDCKLGSHIAVEEIETSIAKLSKRKMNMTFSMQAPSPAVLPQVQGRTNCNIGPFIPRNQPGATPTVQRQFQGGICASTSGSPLQELSNKRARTDGPAIRNYSPQPQAPTTTSPYVRSSPSPGLGVPRNQGASHLGYFGHLPSLVSEQLNIAQGQHLMNNRSKQF